MLIFGWFIMLIFSIYLSVSVILSVWFWFHIGGTFRRLDIFILSVILIFNVGLWYWVVIDFPFSITVK